MRLTTKLSVFIILMNLTVFVWNGIPFSIVEFVMGTVIFLGVLGWFYFMVPGAFWYLGGYRFVDEGCENT